MRKIVAVSIVIIAGIIGWLIFAKPRPSEKQAAPQQQSSAEQTLKFENPKKSAHYETNTPAHGAILPGVPVSVVIDFNFDLAVPSSIFITKDGKEYGVGETVIDANKLAMRRDMDQAAPDGLYTVNYRACWPDRSCHDGLFQFAIDRMRAADFIDMRGKQQAAVNLADIKFVPQNLRISRGTKVIWVNDDEVEHYVNTDSHPAHTHFLALNSKALKTDESFEFIFDKPGVYPYHCSAHEAAMRGMILVE